MNRPPSIGLYGAPHPDLAQWPSDAVQLSPLWPGAARLEDLTPASLDALVLAAPPGTAERRYTLALALRALKPGGDLTAMAPKEKGGSRLGKELAAFACVVEEQGRRHQRLCLTTAPIAPARIEAAIAAGAPRMVEGLGLWSQPGLFSWDRIDAGTKLLLSVLPPLSGHGADLGCGYGLIARAVLAHAGVTRLDLFDLDRRAVEAAQRNVIDARASIHWADVLTAPLGDGLDFVVTNPPFHDAGMEDKGLGQGFIRRAHAMLRKGGKLWLVANRHLPYETALTGLFAAAEVRAEANGFKVYEARK